MSPGPARSLEECIERHGDAIAAFVQAARRVPDDLATRPRAPGKWRPLDEVQHLALTYREFMLVLSGGPEFALLVSSEKAAGYRASVLPRVLAGGWFPRGAQAPERVEPRGGDGTMATALEELELAAEAFHRAVRDAAPSERQWNHPYFGPVPLTELVDLLSEHANHHGRMLPQPG